MKLNYFLWALVIAALPVTVYFVTSSVLLSPIAGAVGIFLALPYAAFYLWLFSRNRAWLKNWAWLWSSVLWGAGVALVVALTAGAPWVTLMQDLRLEMFMASFGGGYPEEIAKALGVFLILLCYGSRPWHGFIVGAMVGLGFEIVENIMYGATGAIMHVESDLHGVLSTWALRAFLGPGLHVMFSAIAGFGIGWALMGRFSTAKRVLIGAGSVALAFVLHFWWNAIYGSVSAQIINFIVVGCIGYPLVIWMYIHCHKAAQQDPELPSTPLQTMEDLSNFRDSVYPSVGMQSR